MPDNKQKGRERERNNTLMRKQVAKLAIRNKIAKSVLANGERSSIKPEF